MRTLIFALLFSVLSVFAARADCSTQAMCASPKWVEGTVMGVAAGNSKYPTAIFINTVDGVAANNARGAYYGYWNTLDLVNGRDPVSGAAFNLPSDIKAVFISGILIITHGPTFELADLAITFRAPGNNLLGGDNRMMQTIEASVGNGQRSNAAVWVPVVNGKVEWYWWVNNSVPYGYPAYSAYGANLSVQGYIR